MSKNDITGDVIKTKPTTDKYRKEWERLFGYKSNPEPKDIPPMLKKQAC